MKNKRPIYLLLLLFLLIGIAFLVGGLRADPLAMTDENTPLRLTLFVIGGIFLILPFVLIVAAFLMGGAKRKKINALLATGQQGEALVLGLEDTGARDNDDPRVSLLLEVRIAGYPPYQITKTAVVPLIRISQVQVGSTVLALADPNEPNNPDKVALLLK